MRCTLDGQVVVAQVHAGPLQEHINDFAQFLGNQGYSLISIRHHSLVVSDFNRWLCAEGLGQRDIAIDHSITYLEERTQQGQLFFQFPAALNQLYRFLYQQELIPKQLAEVHNPCPVEVCLLDFEQHMRNDRGLAKETIKARMRPVRCFLMEKIGSDAMDLSELAGTDIIHFVQRKTTTLAPSSMRQVTSALRSFLRFARYRLLIETDLAASVPGVANWTMTHIPKAISQNQTEQLLCSIDRTTPLVSFRRQRANFSIIGLSAILTCPPDNSTASIFQALLSLPADYAEGTAGSQTH